MKQTQTATEPRPPTASASGGADPHGAAGGGPAGPRSGGRPKRLASAPDSGLGGGNPPQAPLPGHAVAGRHHPPGEPGGRRRDRPARRLWIVRQVAEALAALAAGGWVHGDVKPGNIFLSPRRHVTLLDLGFARRRGENAGAAGPLRAGHRPLPGPGVHHRGRGRGHWQRHLQPWRGPLPAAHRPFAAGGTEPGGTGGPAPSGSPPSLSKLAPRCLREVAALVPRMLAKDPLRRVQTPVELLRQLIPLEIATFSERALA